jgi:hypothetical protein
MFITHYGADTNENDETVIYMFYEDGTEESVVLDECAEGWYRQEMAIIDSYEDTFSAEFVARNRRLAAASALTRMGVDL